MTFRRVPRKRRIWWAIVAVIVAAGLSGAIVMLAQDDVSSEPPAMVAVKRGDVTSSVAASGKVRPVATRELSFATAGTVTSVAVKPGDTVNAGQTLTTIDPTEAQSALDSAQEALDDALAALDTAKSAAAPPAPPPPTASPPSGSPPSGSPSASAPAAALTATAADAQPDKSLNSAVYQAEVAVNKARLARDKAKRVLAGTTITAPTAGKVLEVTAKPGDPVKEGTVITLGVVEKMMVEASFAEADAVGLAAGQQASVKLASHADQSFSATITEVAVLGTTQNRLVTYAVLLEFAEPPANLLIGQSATATVVLQRSSDVLYLPQSAVTTGGDVKLLDGSVRRVEVGLRGDGNVEVRGLDEGSHVALNAR